MNAAKEDFDSISIQNWGKAFERLYLEPDKRRKPEDFWNSVTAHLSRVGEAIRKTNYKEVLKESAYAFCWMCGFISKCNNAHDDPLFRFENCLSEIVALKFPDRCGYCNEVHCHCHPRRKDAESDKSAEYKDLLEHWRKYKSIWITRGWEDWLTQFWEIFDGRIHIQTLESIGFHMLEESGEAAYSIRQLVQLRGLLGVKQDNFNLNSDFLDRLTRIETLVDAWVDFTKRCESKFGKPFKDIEKKEILTNLDEVIIKTRLVRAKMDLVIETADTFSWLCAVLLKLREIVNELGIQREDMEKFHIECTLRDKFCQPKDGEIVKDDKGIPVLKCYVCKNTECKCLFFLKGE